MEPPITYNTTTYKWGDIKECVDDLGIQIPAHLASKDEDDEVMFVVLPGRAKQVTNTYFRKKIKPSFFYF